MKRKVHCNCVFILSDKNKNKQKKRRCEKEGKEMPRLEHENQRELYISHEIVAAGSAFHFSFLWGLFLFMFKMQYKQKGGKESKKQKEKYKGDKKHSKRDVFECKN